MQTPLPLVQSARLRVFLTVLEGGNLQQLQGVDSSFVALESSTTPMHIGSMLIYNPQTAPGGFVRFKDILQFFEDRLQLSRTMRQRLVRVPMDLDYPYWVEDPNFDLEFHIRHVALPRPGDWRQLCIQTARIHARPLDLDRPPWEVTVVEGLDNVRGFPPGCFALITKVHHSAIDGMSGIDMMEATHTLHPDDPPPSKPDSWKPEKIPTASQLLGKSYLNAIVNPVKQAQAAAQVVPGIAKAIRGLVTRDFRVSSDFVAPRTRFNKSISPHRVVEGRTFDLAEFKAIRALLPDAKVNDVALAVVGGALRKYLIAKGDSVDTTLTAMAPISVRSKDEKNAMGNQVAAMIAPLGSHLDDPAKRLEYVHSQTKQSKALTSALGARSMSEMSKTNPALFMALGAQLFSRIRLAHRRMPFNTVVTNVPGPPVQIYSTGARMESMALSLMCLTDGVGLMHVVQSYFKELTISFTACRNIMPDPDFYADCLQESFDEMSAAAKAVNAPPKAKTRKPAAKSAAAKKPATKATKKPAARAKSAVKASPARKKPARSAKRKPQAGTRKVESKPAK